MKITKVLSEPVKRRRTKNNGRKKNDKEKNIDLQNNTNHTKTRMWTQVLRKGEQFLLH